MRERTTASPFLFKKLDFSPLIELSPVALIGSRPLALVAMVVRTGSCFDSLAPIIEVGKKGDVFYASSGDGTMGHLAADSLRFSAASTGMDPHFFAGEDAVFDDHRVSYSSD